MQGVPFRQALTEVEERVRAGQLDEAIAHSLHLLSLFPRSISARYWLGKAYLDKGMHAEAQQCLQEVLDADPENVPAHLGMAHIYQASGSIQEAIYHLQCAFDQAPADLEVRRELGRLQAQDAGAAGQNLELTQAAVARIYAQNGLDERAIPEYRQAIAQNPGLAHARVGLAEALWRQGRRLEAVETCLDLVRDWPSCLKAHLILAQIFATSGHQVDAEARLALAQALDPENHVAQEMMGDDSPFLPRVVAMSSPIATDLPAGAFASAPPAGPPAQEPGEPPPTTSGPEAPPSGEPREPPPTWLTEAAAAGEVAAPLSAEPLPPEAPDWLAEWQPLVPSGVDQGKESKPSEVAAPLEGEIPEWVRRMQDALSQEGPPPGAAPIGGPLPVNSAPVVHRPSSPAADEPRMAELQSLLQHQPHNARARIELARRYRLVGDWEGALLEYEELIAGRRLIPAVIQDLKELLEEPVDKVQVLRLLGDAYMETDETDQALEMYRQARGILRSDRQTG